MKKTSILWLLAFLMSGLATLTACSSNDENPSVQEDTYEEMGLTRKSGQRDGNGIVVSLFERNGMKLQVVDITDQFESATFYDKKVPINHVYVEQLPSAIQRLALSAGSALSTRVCRMEYEGEYYYDIYSLFSSSLTNFYNSKGERHYFSNKEFMSKATNACCLLVLKSEPVKNAEGAPNYLIGYWQNDWQHLTHDMDQQATVTLYPDLPFSITEVMAFYDDGIGYLRTIKTYKDGTNEVALDPFNYVLTDYHGGEPYGYQGYYYKCYFAAGDAIEYLVRSYDNMQTLNRARAWGNYPWFKHL